ncbi:MAG TPA: hypothetical protein VMU51_01340 [Mycobacteriales bacterium]|nr:hypothetical protein [Mycobacteriales bacterium]
MSLEPGRTAPPTGAAGSAAAGDGAGGGGAGGDGAGGGGLVPVRSAGGEWSAAVRRGDRAAFATTVRHTQERIAGHLLGVLRLPAEQALRLTEQTVLDALRTAGQGAAIESPLARLFGTARARLDERLRATFGHIAGLDLPFDPEPAGTVLPAFYAGDRRIDRHLAHRRDLPPFLELMHEAVQTPVRLEALPAVAGVLLLAHVQPDGCPGLAAQLRRAGWAPGEPLAEPGLTGVRQHATGCPTCRPSYDRSLDRLDTLPPLVLEVTLRLAEQRRALTAAVFAADPSVAEVTMILAGAAKGVEVVGSPPGSAGAAAGVRSAGAVGRAEIGWTSGAAAAAGTDAPGRLVAAGRGARDAAGRRRPVVAVAIMVGLLVALVAGWQRLAPGDGGPAPLALDPAASGSPARVPGLSSPLNGADGGQSVAPAGTMSAPPASAPAGSPSRPARPSPTPGRSTAPDSAGPDSSGPASPRPPPGPTATPPPTARPAGRLVIELARGSTGDVVVSIGGDRVGRCTARRTPCRFTLRVGDRVTLRPLDVALAWSGRCDGTSPGDSCTFTAGASDDIQVWVLRFAR